MTTDLLATPTTPSPRSAMPMAAVADDEPGAGSDRPRILGMRCRNCGRPEALGANYVCAGCFGPLEIAYDLEVAARTLDRQALAARPAGIWRYLELLPVTAPPSRGLQVGSTPLVAADRLGEAIGIERLWLKDDTRNPTLSFKDRAVAVAAAQAVGLRPRGAGLRLDRQPGRRHGRGRGGPRPAGLRLHPGRPGAREGRPCPGLRRDRGARGRHL